jgi:hypothetical protein
MLGHRRLQLSKQACFEPGTGRETCPTESGGPRLSIEFSAKAICLRSLALTGCSSFSFHQLRKQAFKPRRTAFHYRFDPTICN